MKDKEKRTCLLIDMPVPNKKKHFFKNSSKTFEVQGSLEIEKTWELKTTKVPVVIGALGLVKKGTENYISEIPGIIGITELQKIVLLGTVHTLRRSLSIK